ncbi:unnamed protein product [Mytilus coruscus]|uniref:B box-type domain-containing protein n=1 Tax=Mytilus coruscus TaxID=42192 RepID=A0A6J8BHK3_MYTCO|nr:unnamed protein product [Mytilus coruscus]
MATNTSVCSICDLRHVTSSSKLWCPECEEALCPECSEYHSLSKGTRSHKTIPISQYQSLPTFVTEIQQFCLYHNEKYQQYCIKHECPICYKCIKEHGNCNEVVPLEDVCSEVKTSELFRDLEQSLKDVLENIKRFQKDKEENFKYFQTQMKDIPIEIDRIKTQIKQHLDKLKKEFLTELEQVHNTNNGRIQSIISSLNDQQNEISNYSTELENIKKYASDLQTFLGMREIQSKVINNERLLKSKMGNKSLFNLNIQLVKDDKIQEILTSVKKFGSILIREIPSANTYMVNKKTGQAQIHVPNKIQSINNISVKFNQKVYSQYEETKECSITPQGLLLFIDN